MIGLLLKAGRRSILATAGAMVAVTALLDWAIGRNESRALLHILPMMVAAVVLRPYETAMLALLCSYLRSRFGPSGSTAELVLALLLPSPTFFAASS